MPEIAVVIPYYQKKTGILRRALTSVAMQQLPPETSVHVIVVDDGSPLPARPETEGITFPPSIRLNIVEQKNGGVASARNTGLSHTGDASYIAFLDSDDIWNPDHLADALTQLEKDYDYYFCDNRRAGSHESYFKLIGFDPNAVSMPVDGSEELREIGTKTLFDSCLRTNASLTSTIVYRKSIAPDQKFNTWLHPAGEDNLFFLQLISRARRACFSTKVSVTYAEGVSIWHGRYDWDAPTHAISQLCRVLSGQEMRKTISMSNDNRLYLDGEINRLRRFYAYLTIRRFLKTRKLWPAGELRLMRCDSSSWIWYPGAVMYVAIGLPLGFYRPPQE